jgi:hypothetical protein
VVPHFLAEFANISRELPLLRSLTDFEEES